MKTKLWLLQIPIILIASAGFLLCELGVRGEIGPSLHDLFVKVRSVSTWFTDRKFRMRGPRPVDKKVVIVAIDSESLSDPSLGRWPWHRNVTAQLIDEVFHAGAKVVGLDIVFSEPDRRIPAELVTYLRGELGREPFTEKQIRGLESDFALEDKIMQYGDKLVLGWTTEDHFQPFYDTGRKINEARAKEIETGFGRFGYSHGDLPPSFELSRLPLLFLDTMIGNLAQYNAVSEHQGYFNAIPDPDGVIRRGALLMLAGRKPLPSLPLEMARVGLKEELSVDFDDRGRVKNLGFAKSGRQLEVTPLGAAEFNFRGPGHAYPYISAHEFFQDTATPTLAAAGPSLPARAPAANPRFAILKDAYVLIGVTALGVFDMRNFPFDSNVAGVEGHATMLDNILNSDLLIPSSNSYSLQWILAFMILGALVFAGALQKLESVPALLMFAGCLLIFGFVDFKLLFANNHVNWDTSFLYLEFSLLFIVTIAAKYVEEENNKKFIRGAFSKYVAPAIVDSILEDPTKLSLGGERRELTILFSDIRGFTTFSERLDAKKLSQFLNDYLGIMTKLVFDHNGTLDKYIGDAIMAFWGAPLDQKDHAANACKTAVAMMKALAVHRERWLKQYDVDVQIGIGLNSGVVSVGNMGSDNNFEYTVIGDHVNLASRLEGLTKAYGAGVVTTRFTFDSIKNAGLEPPPHRVLDFVKVKGKKTAVELIQVLERPAPEEGLKTFAEGLQFYKDQRWDLAIERFRAASSLLSATPEDRDGPCDVYVERCQEFKLNPPARDWDGSWEMHSK